MVPKMVRINTRVSVQVNDWLDKKSYESGVPKSTLVYMALEQYMNQQKVQDALPQLDQLFEQIKELQSQEV